jgi:hypothetical protein
MIGHARHPQGTDTEEVERMLRSALALDEQVKKEGTQQALRQLVRVLKNAGELWLALGNKPRASRLLTDAFRLARNEANTESQANSITKFMEKHELRWDVSWV